MKSPIRMQFLAGFVTSLTFCNAIMGMDISCYLIKSSFEETVL